MIILDSTNTRLCLDTHPVALSYMLIQYATDWEAVLKFLATLSALQGIEIDTKAVIHLMSEYYGE